MLDSVAVMLDAFNAVINGGFQRTYPVAVGLAGSMSALAVMFAAFSVTFNKATMIGTAFKFAVMAAFYVLCINNVQDIGEDITRGSIQLGLTASGSSMGIDGFLASGGLLETGFRKMLLLNELAADSCETSSFGCVGNLQGYLPAAGGAWLVFGVFAGISAIVASVSILFKLSFLAGMPLIPFALVPPTASFGWMPIKAAFHCGTQLMVLAMITGIGNLALTKLEVGIDPGMSSTLPVVFGCVFFAILVVISCVITGLLTHGGLVQAGALFGPGIGVPIAAARSAAGHLDAPATKAVTASYDAMRTAASRISSPKAS